jgi:hypothetical protein
MLVDWKSLMLTAKALPQLLTVVVTGVETAGSPTLQWMVPPRQAVAAIMTVTARNAGCPRFVPTRDIGFMVPCLAALSCAGNG